VSVLEYTMTLDNDNLGISFPPCLRVDDSMISHLFNSATNINPNKEYGHGRTVTDLNSIKVYGNCTSLITVTNYLVAVVSFIPPS
jgi:hypothetical protein